MGGREVCDYVSSFCLASEACGCGRLDTGRVQSGVPRFALECYPPSPLQGVLESSLT